ncbi:GAF domain-containing protein [Sphingomonas rubra]|uniref:histidine kinase n=1 Tax=Sphingomonas rubra TaxID=634430 RepID=A0A1I5QLL9_9SPHN|nr:GAF domain-containing protein [Sphingomonas rubra]SFP47198.1 PAS fold-containing protein [Sphingomonas rubra]
MGDASTTGERARLDALHALEILDTPADPAFDDLVGLAAQLCDAPTALVSLVDADRQWFKARVGFPLPETGLDRSVCCLVVDAGELLVIPDLAADPRTAANPLVTGEPGIRFYAGAPLIGPAGHVLGALCVIDGVARPGGLDPAQRGALASLARLAAELIEVRWRASAHTRSAEASSAADAQWHELFQQLHEGFIIATALRDGNGDVFDWRYDQVNKAWSELVGIDGEAVIGRTIREILPGIESDWIALARVVDTRDTARFTRQVGTLRRWYDGKAHAIGADRFAIIFVEVTERVEAEERQRALLEVGDVLRDCTSVSDMTRQAAEIVGRALHASRAAYGIVDADGGLIDIEPDWTATEIPSIAGRHRFDDYGLLRGDLPEGEPLVIDDVDADPRTAARAAMLHDIAVRAIVNMTVRDRDRLVGMFIVHDAAPRRWTKDELAFIRNVADRLEVGIARLRGQEQQALLNAEISHRLKNSLAMVQAIANRTLKGVTDPDRLDSFQGRLRALGTAHDVLLGRSLRSAEIAEVIDRAMDGAGAAGRYAISGPATRFGARATLSTSLLIHELATNAMKYGSLSTTGLVEIVWHYRDGGDGTLTLDWIERGGPPVVAPTRTGFGSRLVSLGLVGTGGADLRYSPEGFSARFTATKELLEQS